MSTGLSDPQINLPGTPGSGPSTSPPPPPTPAPPPAQPGSPAPPPGPAGSTPPPGPAGPPGAEPPAPTPGAPETPPAAAAPAPGSIRQQLVDRGFPADAFASDEEAMDYLFGADQAYQSVAPYVEIGQQAVADWDNYQQWKQSQGAAPGQPASPTQPQQPEPAWQWNAPEYDPAWANLFDANGQPVPGADPTVVAKVRAYVRWKNQVDHEFFRDPRAVIRRAVEDDLKRLDPKSEDFSRLIEERVNAAIDQRFAQQEAQRALSENEKRFYQTDAAGRRRTDPRTGRHLLTPQGMALAQHRNELVQNGMDPNAAMAYAIRLVDADVAAGKFGPPQPPAAAPEAGNGETPPTPPADPREAFLERVRRDQQRYPGAMPPTSHDGTIPRSPEEPVPSRPRTAHEIAHAIAVRFGDIKQ